MRIALVTNILAPYRIELLNRVAASQGVDMMVFLAAEREPERHWSWFDDIAFEYQFVRGVSWRGRHGFIRHFNVRVVHLVRSWKPDVVVAGGTLTLSLLGLAAARWAGCPFVWWMDATSESDAAMSYGWLMPAKRWLARQAATAIASSTLSAAYLVQLGVRACLVHESLLGIDPEPFSQAVERHRASREEIARELGLDGSVILYVGQLESYKGVDLLLRACELVAARQSVSLLIVGTGSLDDTVRRQVATSSCKVVLAGFVQPAELPRYYAVADVFCLLSLCEAFGVVVAEAVSARLPVVCSCHAGASGDLVRDGENGFVVSPEDCERVAECIRTVISDPATAAQMRHASDQISRSLDPCAAARGVVLAAEQAIAAQAAATR